MDLTWLTFENVMLGGVLALMFVLGCLFFFPLYNVWAADQAGKADLARAQREQMIQLAQAEARLHAAEKNKAAAIIEAEAVSEQVSRIGEHLQRHDLYLKWQWIKMMEERDGATIYVPTEANLPILEARR